MKNLLLGCVGIVAGILVGGIIALVVFSAFNYATFSRSPSIEPILQPNRPDLTVTASNTFVSSQLEQAIVKSGFTKQAKVSLFSPNIVQVSAPVPVSLFGQSLSIDATVSMAVAVERGRITLTAQDVQAAGIGVPPSTLASDFDAMRKQAEDQINRDLQRSIQGTKLVVTDIRVSPLGLSIDFKKQ